MAPTSLPKKNKPKLTARQKMFVAEYLVDLNATQAAIRAGYKAKNADQISSRLIGKSQVAEAIQQAQQKRAERTEVTADMVVEQLRRIAFLDVKDVLTFGPTGVAVKDSKEVDGTVLSEVSETTTKDGGTIRVKPSDRMQALELLGRHLGMFNDKRLLLGPNGGPIQVQGRVDGIPEELVEKELQRIRGTGGAPQ